jgi:hypothetical protein
MLLSKNPRFVSEHKDFSEKISRITDKNKQNEMSALLKKLVYEVNAIDSEHQELIFGAKMMPSSTERRQTLFHTRKKIFDKLREYERLGLIK